MVQKSAGDARLGRIGFVLFGGTGEANRILAKVMGTRKLVNRQKEMYLILCALTSFINESS